MSQAATTEPKDAAQEGFELRITRTFDAPRELVWKAWTEPEMAKQWAGPRGFRATEFSRLSEAGSSWRMTMEGHRPGVQSIATLHQGGTVKEVRPPELLVYTFAWLDPAEVGLTNKDVQEMVVTVRLEEKGSKTVMTFTQGPFLSAGARDGHNGGWNSAFDKFAEFLMAEQPGRVEDPEDVPTELHLKRFFAAPRELVFAAWTKPEMVAAWWGAARLYDRGEGLGCTERRKHLRDDAWHGTESSDERAVCGGLPAVSLSLHGRDVRQRRPCDVRELELSVF